VKALENGVDIGGYFTKPCKITMDSDTSGEITLTEGKYHQIKRMLEAVDNKITYLERITFGGIRLDTSLDRGEWRYLTADEEALFINGGK
jgi:16S rRNA pseudouridine516 synthase